MVALTTDSAMTPMGQPACVGLGAPTADNASTCVFLVHGRAGGDANSVARFLETKVGLAVRVLADMANKGRIIITKFQEESAGAGYAVVLMTADDLGQLRPELAQGKSSIPKVRARQNVIFELGYFLGRLGSDRVSVLVDPSVEKPSD